MNNQKIKSEKAVNRNVFKFICNQLQKTQNYIKNKSKSKINNIKFKKNKNQDKCLINAK